MSTTESPATGVAADGSDDRRRELQAFDDTKAGVKGLVDAGVTAIPAIFHHPPDSLQDLPTTSSPSSGDDDAPTIPVIDLSSTRREETVARVKQAAETVGFFQIVNHGVPDELMAAVLAGARRFHEGPAEAKRRPYSRDITHKVRFSSNFDLFESGAANWRDTLTCILAPRPPRPEELPEPVRNVTLEYGDAVTKVALRVFELLSEALGMPSDHLRELGCAQSLNMDGIGGLQVLLGQGWVDVPPCPGALIVNIGDFLQFLSNDRFRSVEHRVVVNRSRDTARVSVPCFYNADVESSTTLYGPITGGSNDPPIYGSVTVQEFMARFYSTGLEGRALDHFRLQH